MTTTFEIINSSTVYTVTSANGSPAATFASLEAAEGSLCDLGYYVERFDGKSLAWVSEAAALSDEYGDFAVATVTAS